MDTSGFYKIDNTLLYAPNFVYAPTFTLVRADYQSYTYPMDGWYWFDTEVDATTFFNIEPSGPSA